MKPSSRPDLRSARGAVVRARIFALLRFSLLFWACVYFALVVISGHTYLRSLAFALSAIFALWLILGALFSDGEPIPVPDAYLWVTVLAWSLWSAASLAWSIHPALSRSELGTEVGWGLATATIFYVAARSATAFRAGLATAVGAGAVLSVLAIHGAVLTGSVDPERALTRAHGGAGAFSTYIVLLMPLLPLLLQKRPVGFGISRWSIAIVGAVFALLGGAGRVTENRMIWIALAAGVLLAAMLAAWRWRSQLLRAPLRWGGVLLALLMLAGALFVDSAITRSRTDYTRETSVAQAIATDPRFLLWQRSFERIRERPWTGYGFGKSILHDELQGETGNPLLAHAHNLFVSQWLQTGIVGAAAMLAMLLALCMRYWTFLRAPDETLAVIGLAGLVMLLVFVVKNLTDDFMIRPTSKEFWTLNALLVGYGIRRALVAAVAPATPDRAAVKGA
ncbi:MAG: O-antigen ligase family protein [Burkholderiales bacterium]|nr:O-antigen ligase family protein [Burkholderiales bacterium]